MARHCEKESYHALNVGLASGYAALSKLKQANGSWARALENFEGPLPVEPARALRELEALGVALLLPDDEEFPPLLKEIPLPPHGLYVKGSSACLLKTAVAIVGTRKPTAGGRETARDLAREVASRGVSVVSGLAFGIDAAAHEGCLAGGEATAAVLPSGLDRVYPRSNERLARALLEQGGALVSEFPPHTEVFAYHFLRRNRLISGLARACCLVEVPERSGALATARFAVDQNRDVLVVPGNIRDPHYAGSNRLIRAGAQLVTSSADILEALGLSREAECSPLFQGENEEEQRVIAALRGASGPLNIDKMVELTKLNIQALNQTLTFLAIKNVVKETDDGFTL